MITLEKVLLLKSLEIFKAIPDHTLAEVAGILEEVEIQPGQTLIREGEMDSFMYLIVDGKVKVSKGDLVLAELGERQVVGELSALDPEPRMATVTALETTRVLKLDGDLLYECMADHLGLARGLFKVLCDRLRSKST